MAVSGHGTVECEVMDVWDALDAFEAMFFRKQYKMLCRCQGMLLSSMRSLDHQANRNLASLRSQIDKLVNKVSSCHGKNIPGSTKNGHRIPKSDSHMIGDIVQVVDRFEAIEHSYTQRHAEVLDRLSQLFGGEMKRTQEAVVTDLTDLQQFVEKINARLPNIETEKSEPELKTEKSETKTAENTNKTDESSSEESESSDESCEEGSEKKDMKEATREKKTDSEIKKEESEKDSSEESSEEESSSGEESESESEKENIDDKEEDKKPGTTRKDEPLIFRKIRRPWEQDLVTHF